MQDFKYIYIEKHFVYKIDSFFFCAKQTFSQFLYCISNNISQRGYYTQTGQLISTCWVFSKYNAIVFPF